MKTAVLARKTEAKNAAPKHGGAGSLRVSEPDESFEREADRAAGAVMRGERVRPSLSFAGLDVWPRLNRRCACADRPEGGKCEACRRAEGVGAPAQESQGGLSHVRETLNGGGRPLDRASREFFEPRFGRDFGDVRVHSDTKAARSAAAVDASAYTVGRDIVFGAGRFAPGTQSGMELLAHELAHVAQFAHAPASGESGVVARQTAGAKPGGGANEPVYLDRSHFDGRFDAYVNPRAHNVTLIMNLDFEMGSWGNRPDGASALKAFKPKMKQVVEREWSLKFDLQPACSGEESKFHAYVQVNVDGGAAHNTVHFFPDMAGGRSGVDDNQSALKETDADMHENKRPFQPSPGAKPVERTFMQYTAAHEFGHMLGLPHPHCAGNADQCYGVKPEEAMDVMGLGSLVSKRDYAPFQKIMKIYGEGRFPGPCNDWKLVEVG